MMFRRASRSRAVKSESTPSSSIEWGSVARRYVMQSRGPASLLRRRERPLRVRSRDGQRARMPLDRASASSGVQVGEGTVAGINAERPRVERAAADLLELPRQKMRAHLQLVPPPRAPEERATAPLRLAAPRVGGAATGGHGGLTIENLTIQVSAPSGDANDIAAAVREELERTLRGVAANLGAPVGTTSRAKAA
jgi:hypothetical protein